MNQAAASVTVVTQTCVRPDCIDAFRRWQAETSAIVARYPGFLDEKLMPPSPPTQVDWVILQRFDRLDNAQRWLHSGERKTQLDIARPILLGRDDVHVVRDGASGAQPAPVSVVISTRVRPGMEMAYREWEQRIAVAQFKAPGFQGYRLEPPVPGLQDDFLAILRFDSEANLKAWMDSPERKALVEEANPFTEEFHARVVRTGFEQWFREAAGGAPLPVWKMDMLVLLMLYPIVFLWNTFVGGPFLHSVPFAIALFIGNIVSVLLTGMLVPWIANRMGWWLQPAGSSRRLRTHILGAGILIAIYAAMVVAFWRLF